MNYKKLVVVFLHVFFVTSLFGSPEITTIENVTKIMKESKEQGFSHCPCPVFPEERRVPLIKSLTEQISQIYPERADLFSIAFYGCGIGFADEVTTLTVLKQCGFKSITPYFIDPVFTKKEARERTVLLMHFINAHPEIKKGGCFTSAQEFIEHTKTDPLNVITAVDLGDKGIKLEDVLSGYVDICEEKGSIESINSLSCYDDMIGLLNQSRQKERKEKAMKYALKNLSAIEF
jgi:hypothetical protein